MIAAASARGSVIVQSSRVASGRHPIRRTQQQLSTKNPSAPCQLSSSNFNASSPLLVKTNAAASHHPTARWISNSARRKTTAAWGATAASNGPPEAALTHAAEPVSSWTGAEVLASTLLAIAASGTFLLLGSTSVKAPPTAPRIHYKGSGGGGGGGGHHHGSSNSLLLGKERKPQAQTTRMEEFGPPYDVSVRALQGGRLTMEDEFFVTNGGRFAAVFDGHGGGGVSAFLKDRLYDYTGQFLSRTAWEQEDDSSKRTDSKASLSSYVAALRLAFSQIDEDVLEDDKLQYQGSTAVAVVVHEGEDGHRTLLSANVGDSRAILSRNQRAVDLTRDHKPNDEREKARILGMGETIEWDHYCKVHRVRNLSLSRAIGDRFAKPVVSGQVEIKHFPVEEDHDEFFLLASDGLWDVMSSQEVVSYVHDKLNAPPPGGVLAKEDAKRLQYTRRKNMSRHVATEALKRGSCDNVCVLIVWLDKDSLSR